MIFSDIFDTEREWTVLKPYSFQIQRQITYKKWIGYVGSAIFQLRTQSNISFIRRKCLRGFFHRSVGGRADGKRIFA